ncbi:dienelactone hydrolase family protein [Bacillus sp. FJAT-49705]|uniref:Dienelactone hydrolase family protein n=1 Tax=Cytobacillus citreus TaxID=2833586 RepID=A0ABS5NXW2_9BACI|nr:dienelactone hydrolase family protein [Cytobacillus citreus]MBS4192646.1 dienelactone hydrolase family protein [Cytobacillus citreus]
MINILNKSDSVIIVVHEIYGINKHMEHVCQRLSENHFDIICPNLLGQEAPYDYSQEEAAYRHFVGNIGFMNASEKIKNVILDCKDKYKKVYLLGFSIGATIAWLCSEEECLDGMVGYYGSRIRNYTDINPKCPTMLFFPETEPSFNVDDLISCLDEKKIEIRKFNGQHGFSDPYSPKYDVKSAQQSFRFMVDFYLKLKYE